MGQGAGSQAVSREKAMTLCFDLRSGYQGPSKDRGFSSQGQAEVLQGLTCFLPTFLLAASVLYHQSEWNNGEITEVMVYFPFFGGGSPSLFLSLIERRRQKLEKMDHPRRGQQARSLVCPADPWGSRTRSLDNGPSGVIQNSLLNSIRILENFCTVISSGLLFGLLKREKFNSKDCKL